MFANGDNLALEPWFVNQSLQFRKAVNIRVKEKREAELDIDYLDAAHGFDDSGNLNGLGRVKNWTIQSPEEDAQVRFVLTAGLDADGDYVIAKGEQAHWVATNVATGQVIEPS